MTLSKRPHKQSADHVLDSQASKSVEYRNLKGYYMYAEKWASEHVQDSG